MHPSGGHPSGGQSGKRKIKMHSKGQEEKSEMAVRAINKNQGSMSSWGSALERSNIRMASESKKE